MFEQDQHTEYDPNHPPALRRDRVKEQQQKRTAGKKNKDQKQKNKSTLHGWKRAIWWCAFSVCFVALCVSGYFLISQQLEYRAAENEYSSLEELVPPPDDSVSLEVGLATRQLDHEQLASINSDYAAWLYLPETNIDYPVVKGTNNQYYVAYTFQKKRNGAGSLFIDYRNQKDFSDKNTIIYGHNMRNKTMFYDLISFKTDENFFRQNPCFYLYTPTAVYRVDIFTVYVAPADGDQTQFTFSSDEAFLAYAQEKQAQSLYETDVELTATDRIVTFSTCSYEFDNARTIVQGVLRDVTPEQNE